MKLRSENKKFADKIARTQIYVKMKSYLIDVLIGYLCIITCKTRKINKLFGFEYDSITLKKIKDILEKGYIYIPCTFLQRWSC